MSYKLVVGYAPMQSIAEFFPGNGDLQDQSHFIYSGNGTNNPRYKAIPITNIQENKQILLLRPKVIKVIQVHGKLYQLLH